MDARYLRVKNWPELQHYSKRRPPWIKSYARLLLDDRFNELSELEQLWLTKLWLLASQSSRFTMDDDKVVPVIPFEEKSLRVSIRASRKIPLERFIRDGWLIPLSEAELVDPEADTGEHRASTALAKSEQESSPLVQRTENRTTDAFTVVRGEEKHRIGEQVERSLARAAAC